MSSVENNVNKMQFYERENLWLIQRPMDASWSNLCEIRSHFTRRELCCIILLIAWMVLEILNLNVWSLKMDQQYKSYADYVYVTKVLAFAMLLSLGNWKLNRIVCLCARNSSIFFHKLPRIIYFFWRILSHNVSMGQTVVWVT